MEDAFKELKMYLWGGLIASIMESRSHTIIYISCITLFLLGYQEDTKIWLIVYHYELYVTPYLIEQDDFLIKKRVNISSDTKL